MTVIIYGDFNCPYSYLASQRADMLSEAGVAMVDWRAVEHDWRLPVTGSRSDRDRDVWERELADVASLALPGEHVPDKPPVLVSNTKAAVAAYAEAVSDGVAEQLRRRLFRAIWVQGLHLSSAYEVRRLVTAVMWPRKTSPGGWPARTSPAGCCGIRTWPGWCAGRAARSRRTAGRLPPPGGGGSGGGVRSGWRCPAR